MKKITLLALGALGFISMSGQTWISESSHRAQIVNESFVSRDQEVVIFKSYENTNQTGAGLATNFHSLDDGKSWAPMYKHDGTGLYSPFFTKIQDTLFSAEGSGSTGRVEISYSVNNGVSWDTLGSAKILNQWTGGIMSFHSFFGKLFISRDDTLMICNSDLSSISYVNQYFGSTSFYAECGIKEIIQLNSDLYAISSPFSQVWKSSDQGLSWQNISYGVNSFLEIVVDNNKVYTLVHNGDIYELDPANSQWTLIGDLGSAKARELNISGDTIVGKDNQHIVVSTDGGANFSNLQSFVGFGINDASPTSPPMLKRINNTYIVGGIFGTMRSAVSTLKFKSALKGHTLGRSTNDIVRVNGEEMQIGQYGMKYRYDNLNDEWIYLGGTVKYLDGGNITAYKPQLKSYGDTVFSTYPDLLMTLDMGDTWDTILEGGGTNPYAYMDMEIVGNDLYLSTTSDLRVSSDMGATWNVLQLGSSAFCYKNGEIFHSDSNGEITFSTDNGGTFTNIHGNLPGKVLDIKVAGGTIFAVVNLSAWNSGNEVWHSGNRSGTWVQDTMFINGNVDGSTFDLLECNDKIIGTTRSDMYITSDLGVSWQKINYNLDPSNQFLAIDVFPREFANDTLYGVSRDSIYKLYFPKAPIGLEEKIGLKTIVSVFPNPSSGIVYLKAERSIQNVELYNLEGKRFYSQQLYSNEGRISLEKLPKGIYSIIFTFDEGILSRKLIIE